MISMPILHNACFPVTKVHDESVTAGSMQWSKSSKFKDHGVY
jgi:hypothetical protein